MHIIHDVDLYVLSCDSWLNLCNISLINLKLNQTEKMISFMGNKICEFEFKLDFQLLKLFSLCLGIIGVNIFTDYLSNKTLC